MNRRERNSWIGIGAAATVVAALVYFVPVSWSTIHDIPARVYAGQVWSLEHSGRGELVARLDDRGRGVQTAYRVLAIDRGDAARFELADGVTLGMAVGRGDTLGSLISTTSDRALAALEGVREVARFEVDTQTEGAKQSQINALVAERSQVAEQVALQRRITARLDTLQRRGLVSTDELERARTSELALAGRMAVLDAELAVLETGARPSDLRLAEARLRAAGLELEALQEQREAFVATSPFDGQITRSAGDSVLVTVKDMSRWTAVMPVPVDQLGLVPEGTRVELSFRDGQGAFLIVDHIDPTIQTLGGADVVLVTGHLDPAPEGMLDGQYATVRLTEPPVRLRMRVARSLSSVFRWQTWWGHAPRA